VCIGKATVLNMGSSAVLSGCYHIKQVIGEPFGSVGWTLDVVYFITTAWRSIPVLSEVNSGPRSLPCPWWRYNLPLDRELKKITFLFYSVSSQVLGNIGLRCVGRSLEQMCEFFYTEGGECLGRAVWGGGGNRYNRSI